MQHQCTFARLCTLTFMSYVLCTSATQMSVRCKSEYVRIANHKKVERFLATRFHLPTRLRTAAPEIAAEWNYDKNPMHLYPEIIGIGYMDEVWWTCSKCGLEFKMSVEKRVVRGKDCPECTRSHFSKVNSMQVNTSNTSLTNGQAESLEKRDQLQSNADNDVSVNNTNDVSGRMLFSESTAGSTIKHKYDNRLPGECNPKLQFRRPSVVHTKTVE